MLDSRKDWWTASAPVTIAPVSSRRRAGEKVEQEGGPDPGAAWAEALERFSAMSVPERAAEVLKMVAPAIAENWEKASFKHAADMERRLGEGECPTGAHRSRGWGGAREEVTS